MSNCVAGYVERCMKGICQIWSVRDAHGARLTTLETQIKLYGNGFVEVSMTQHKSHRNGAVPIAVRQLVRRFVAELMAAPEQMQDYLDWRRTTVRRPIEARQHHALMQPVITALRVALPRQWSWEIISGNPAQASDALQ